MLDFDILSIGFFAIIYFVLIIFLKKKNNQYSFLFVLTLFYIYLVMVIKYTQFPILWDDLYVDAESYKVSYNLVPLFNLTSGQFTTSVLNIILFLPFGFLFYILSRFSFSKTIFMGFLTSFLVELVQFCISFLTKVSFRVFDVNDLIFNTLGVFIGIIVFIFFSFLIKKIIDIKYLKTNSFLNYILFK